MSSNRSIRWILIFATIFLTAGCGRKTAPVPPQSVLPAKISDLALQTNETGTTLTWSWPDRSERGGKIRKLSHFLIEKAEYQSDGFCQECPIRYDRRFKITAGALPAKNNRLASYQDTELKPGHHYIYRVSSSVGWNVVSQASDPVVLAWEIPLAAPAELLAQGGDSEVNVSWQAVSSDITGNLVEDEILYRVYRYSEDGTSSPVGDPVSQTRYRDTRVINGSVYRYKVMALRSGSGGGRFSEITEARPSDLTPPPAPRGLQSIRTTDGVTLLWDPVTAKDMAGYKIFRRETFKPPEPGQEPMVQDLEYKEIGSVLSPATSFTDHNIPKSGSAWHYAVTSFDTATPPNISPLSWEVKIKREQ